MLPFNPYQEAAAIKLGASSRAPGGLLQQALDSEQELTRVLHTLRDVRSSIYQHLDEVGVCVFGVWCVCLGIVCVWQQDAFRKDRTDKRHNSTGAAPSWDSHPFRVVVLAYREG